MSESETSLTKGMLFIDEVHDRSENEQNTEVKRSVVNTLYERGEFVVVYNHDNITNLNNYNNYV